MADVLDDLLRYGLFFGAIFQLACIAAVVLIPPRDESRDSGDSSDEDIMDGPAHHPSHRHHGHHPNKRYRPEKKKRR